METRRLILKKRAWSRSTRLITVLCLLGLTLALAWAADQSSGARVFFSLQQATPLGGGAALSPNGTTLVYVAPAPPHTGLLDELYAAGVGTGEQHKLIAERSIPGELDDPAFSPDGGRIVFSASGGGTWYYPSEIYSINIDGSGLARLTHSKRIDPNHRPQDVGNAEFAQYFNSPQFAPDGSKILVDLSETLEHTDTCAVMNPDGSNLKILVEGTPLFWGIDSRSFYYEAGDTGIGKFDLGSGATEAVQGLPAGVLDPYSSGPAGEAPLVLGKLLDKDWFLTVDPKSHKVGLVSVQHGAATFQEAWNVALSEETPQGTAWLVSIQWTSMGRALLTYKGEKFERFEVAEASY